MAAARSSMPAKVELLAQNASRRCAGLRGSPPFPDVLQQHFAGNQVVGTAGKTFQEPEGDSVTEAAGLAAPASRECRPVGYWSGRRAIAGGLNRAGRRDSRANRECCTVGFWGVSNGQDGVIQQISELSQAGRNFSQSFQQLGIVIGSRHGICSYAQSASGNNSHARENATARRRKVRDRSVRGGLKMSNGVAVRDTVIANDGLGYC